MKDEEGVTMAALNISTLINEESLYCEYQPVAHSENISIFAYEALMRSTPRIAPPVIFQHARMVGELYKLDTTCITNAIKNFPFPYYQNHFLFINIQPSTTIHREFKNYIQDLLHVYPHIKGRIVFEINEDINEWDIWGKDEFIQSISFLKSHGFSIALDDLPVEKTSFDRMEFISPEFIKLDPTKAKGLAQSTVKQQVVSLFLEYTQNNTKLVLEGIETDKDLRMARRLGVHLLQGFYISKPKRL
jgi:EAL domain-containing protein (putative c-di-GMP-specific phosphodiesterase class I)